jgi:hypothetical protein
MITREWPDIDRIYRASGEHLAARDADTTGTLTGYALAVLVVLAILNGTAWFVGAPRRYGLSVFSAGFTLEMLGMYIAAHLYGYKRSSI